VQFLTEEKVSSARNKGTLGRLRSHQLAVTSGGQFHRRTLAIEGIPLVQEATTAQETKD
jgi:hypothetical protein